MKKIAAKLGGQFLAAVFIVGQLTANSASVLEFYQPKVPGSLKR